MSIPRKHPITLEAFYKMREKTEQLIEYVDGIVFMSPSPSTQHNGYQGDYMPNCLTCWKTETVKFFMLRLMWN